MFKSKNHNVQAIMDKQLFTLLEQTNQKNDFDNGKIKCVICGDIIRYANLGAIRPVSCGSKIEFCCDKYDCLTTFLK